MRKSARRQNEHSTIVHHVNERRQNTKKRKDTAVSLEPTCAHGGRPAQPTYYHYSKLRQQPLQTSNLGAPGQP